MLSLVQLLQQGSLPVPWITNRQLGQLFGAASADAHPLRAVNRPVPQCAKMVQTQFGASSTHHGLMSKPTDSKSVDLKASSQCKSSTSSSSSHTTTTKGSQQKASTWGQFQNASHFKNMHNY